MLSVLYSAVGFIGLCAYLPQIAKILRTSGKCEDLSLNSWAIWFASSLVTTLYAAIEVKDTLYAVMSGANCFFVTLTMGLILWRRFGHMIPTLHMQPAYAYARVKVLFVVCALSSLSLLTYLR